MHPEQPSRITAIERASRRAAGWGLSVCGPRRRSVGADQVDPERYVASIERTCASGGAYLDADTVVSERLFEAALHAAGGRCGWSSCCWTGRHRRRSARTGPPVTTPCRPRRWGSACSTTSPSPRDTRSTCGKSSGDHPRLGRTPRQQHQSALPREQPGAVRLDPSIAAVPRTGPAYDFERARAGASRSTCRSFRDPATRSGCRSSSTSSYRSRTRSSHDSRWSPRDTTRIATICSRIAP